MIADRLDNWRASFSGPVWSRAFEALAALGPDSPEGETRLDGDDLILRVMGYTTRPPEQAVLETHRVYIDIQTTLAGSERIDWFPAAGLEVAEPYDPQKDVTFYRRPGPAPAHVDVFPGTFAVLLPGDAHMPQLMTGSRPEAIRKAVVKVRAGLVQPMS